MFTCRKTGATNATLNGCSINFAETSDIKAFLPVDKRTNHNRNSSILTTFINRIETRKAAQ